MLPDQQGSLQIEYANGKLKDAVGSVRDELNSVEIELHDKALKLSSDHLEFDGVSQGGTWETVTGTLKDTTEKITYKGCFRNWMRHGPGVIVFPDGAEICATFCEDVLDAGANNTEHAEPIIFKDSSGHAVHLRMTNNAGSLEVHSFTGDNFAARPANQRPEQQAQELLERALFTVSEGDANTINLVKKHELCGRVLQGLAALKTSVEMARQDGGMQIGTFHNFLLNGFGLWCDGASFQAGRFIDGKLQLGICYDQQGGVLRLGALATGYLDGYGILINDDGVFQGRFLGGKLAVGDAMFRRSQTRFIGEFLDGVPGGAGRFYWGSSSVQGAFRAYQGDILGRAEPQAGDEKPYPEHTAAKHDKVGEYLLSRASAEQNAVDAAPIVLAHAARWCTTALGNFYARLQGAVLLANEHRLTPVGMLDIHLDEFAFRGELVRGRAFGAIVFSVEGKLKAELSAYKDGFTGFYDIIDVARVRGKLSSRMELCRGVASVGDGVTLRGTFVNDKLDGNGSVSTPDALYCGIFSHGTLQNGDVFYRRQHRMFSGSFHDMQPIEGVLREPGERYTGPVVAGKPDGEGVLEIIGALKYTGGFEMGCFSGDGQLEIMQPKKMTFRGVFAEGGLRDNEAEWEGDGRTFRGRVEGLQLIEGEMTLENGAIFRGTFKDLRPYEGVLERQGGERVNGIFNENLHLVQGEVFAPAHHQAEVWVAGQRAVLEESALKEEEIALRGILHETGKPFNLRGKGNFAERSVTEGTLEFSQYVFQGTFENNIPSKGKVEFQAQNCSFLGVFRNGIPWRGTFSFHGPGSGVFLGLYGHEPVTLFFASLLEYINPDAGQTLSVEDGTRISVDTLEEGVVAVSFGGEVLRCVHSRGALCGQGELFVGACRSEVSVSAVSPKSLTLELPEGRFAGWYYGGPRRGSLEASGYHFDGVFQQRMPKRGRFTLKETGLNVVLSQAAQLAKGFGFPEFAIPNSLVIPEAELSEDGFLASLKENTFGT